jgi:hypothetical protein
MPIRCRVTSRLGAGHEPRCTENRIIIIDIPRDSETELDAMLIGVVGRRLTMGQVYDALEMSRSTYHQQRNEGRLITADNLIRAANNLGINPVDLLVRYNLLTPETVVEYVAKAKGGSVRAPC